MLLEGQDALLLPRESYSRDKSVKGLISPENHNISAIIKQVKPESENVDSEIDLKTIDECLSLKLSATVGT